MYSNGNQTPAYGNEKTEAQLKSEVCYVVECSAGSYDDYRSWIAGIFPSVEDAEKLKEEITNRIELIKATPCPFDEDNLEALTSKELDAYDKWWNDDDEATEFNSAKVVEYPFGRARE